MPKPRAPKFKVGQVVSVETWTEIVDGGYDYRHGFVFGKITNISARIPAQKPSSQHCYFLDGWICAKPEKHLRALTKREAGRG